jgi:endonuclease/exonuclease/phosphatase (EEP) superfamily protein YafD
MPDGAGPAAIPILYKSSRFRLVSTGTQQVSDATYVGPSGAGPSTIAPKFLSYVHLLHRVTGQDMYVINSHAVASVQASDGGPNYEHPERLGLYRQHMDGLKAMIAEFEATGAAVFTTGDFNVNYRRDSVLRDKLFPYDNMSQVDVFASYTFLGMPEYGTHLSESGTNDTRLIDYVSSLSHPAVVPKAQKILMGYSSDHRPVRVRYAITGTTVTPSAAGDL